MNYLEINNVQAAFFAEKEVSDKEQGISRICLNTVLGESPFSDQKMKIQLMSGCELRGKRVRFYGASFGITGCRLPLELPKSLTIARPLGTVPVTSIFSSG